jgi:hypothetical protein
METTGDHWHPGRYPSCPARIGPPRPGDAASAPDADDATVDVPATFARRTLIIWYLPTCAACNHAKGFMRRLEESPNDFAIVRVQATRGRLERFPHVQTLPLFDLVFPEPGAASPYGPGTSLVTVRNYERRRLREYFPAVVFAGAAE